VRSVFFYFAHFSERQYAHEHKQRTCEH